MYAGAEIVMVTGEHRRMKNASIANEIAHKNLLKSNFVTVVIFGTPVW